MKQLQKPLTKSIAENELATVLANDVNFSGDLATEEPLLIKCNFSGSVASKMEVYVSKKARVQAKIYARKVSIHGRVEGDVNAEHSIELFSTAILRGNIATQDLITQSGSRFTGNCVMPEIKEI